MQFSAITTCGILLLVLGPESPDQGANPITPDVDLQQRIDRAIRAGRDEGLATWEQAAAVEKELGAAARETPERFIEQLVYYGTTRVEPGDLPALSLLAHFRVSKMSMVYAATPYLRVDHARVRSQMRQLLKHVDNPSNSATYRDFSYYFSYLGDKSVTESSREALMQYMFERDPGAALAQLALLRLSDREQMKRLLWAEHVVSDALWKETWGFLDEAGTRDLAFPQLETLSLDRDWWVRLYVAEILRRHRNCRSPELIARLSQDEHPVVRQVMGSLKRTTD